MRKTTLALRLFTTLAALLPCSVIQAQISVGNVFLQGNYVEVGISQNGSFGSTQDAPTGYHPHPTGFGSGPTVYNITDGTCAARNSLGFVADPGMDGWTVGTPAYMGDYFLPGSPQEGWAFAVGLTNETQCYYPAWQSCPSTGFAGTGGLTGSVTNYTATATMQEGTWEGTMGTLTVKAVTRVIIDKLYFTTKVTVVNTGSFAVNDIYYMRTVDPDNDETWTGGSFTTNNSITWQLPNAFSNSLVSAVGTGTGTGSPYLGLGSKDCRAKVFIVTSGLTPTDACQQLYDQTGSNTLSYSQGTSSVSDQGIGIVFHVPTIAPGDSTSFSYAYILNAADIDEALGSTAPVFLADGSIYTAGDTIPSTGVCGYLDTVQLSIQNGTGYNWHWSPPIGLSDTVGDTVTAIISGPITYTAIGTGPCGTDTAIIHFNPVGGIPLPTVTTPIIYCQNDVAVPLTATAVDSLHWYDVPSGGTPYPSAPIPSTTTPGTTTYYVAQYLDTCESNRVPIDVIVKPLPAQPTVTANPNPVCTGNALNLNATTTVTGATFAWTGPSSFTSAIANPVINPADIPNAGVYSVTATFNGCTSIPGTVNVVVNQTPLAPVATSNGPICDSNDLQLNVTSELSTSTFSWTGPGGFTSPIANPLIPNATTADSGVYTVFATSQGCIGPSTTLVVVVHSHPGPPVTDTVKYCQFDVATPLTATGTAITWYDSMTGGTAYPAAPTPSTNTPGFYYFYASQTINGCEGSRSMLVVEVDQFPSVSFATDRDTICVGQQIGIYANVTPGFDTVLWNFGDGTSLMDPVTLSHSYEDPGSFTIQLHVGFPLCPSSDLTHLVHVLDFPHVNLGPDTSICPGQGPIILTTITGFNPAAAWLWNTGETTTAISVMSDGLYYATASLNGCSGSDSIMVFNDCYVNLPNIFSPNGDGLNDFFFPRQYLSGSVTQFKLSIFNRWGEKIYETTATDGRGWDGRFNDVDQPQGVYIYLMDAFFENGVHQTYQGNVTLIR